MEEKSQSLVNILSTKKVYLIIVIGTPDANGLISQKFDPPLEFNENVIYMVSLISFSASSLFPNINTDNNKFYYSELVYGVQTSKVIAFDTGAYNIEDINKHIKDILGENIITIELNPGNGKSIIKLYNNCKVYFKDKENTFADLLGFDKKDINSCNNSSSVHTSQRMVNIIRDMMIFVSSDCIDGSFYNGKKTQILYSFLNNIRWGYPINLNVKFPEEHLLRRTNKINRILFSFTNQDNQPITLMNKKISLKIMIKQV